MRQFPSQFPTAESAAKHGPALIGAGLATLVAAMIHPAVPAVTAMALVALGATAVALELIRAASALLPAMLLHLAVYAVLYALFVGATLHAAARHAGGITTTQSIDLAVSVLPMVAAAWLSTVAMRKAGGGGDAPAR
jgi:hypothetical protein